MHCLYTRLLCVMYTKHTHLYFYICLSAYTYSDIPSTLYTCSSREAAEGHPHGEHAAEGGEAGSNFAKAGLRLFRSRYRGVGFRAKPQHPMFRGVHGLGDGIELCKSSRTLQRSMAICKAFKRPLSKGV